MPFAIWNYTTSFSMMTLYFVRISVLILQGERVHMIFPQTTVFIGNCSSGFIVMIINISTGLLNMCKIRIDNVASHE